MDPQQLETVTMAYADTLNRLSGQVARDDNGVFAVPPEEIVSGVTPWKKAMNRILAGMALCSITLNALCLNYILPVTGIILLLLGFRALRGENRWFRTCFFSSLLSVRYTFFRC